MHSVFTHCDPLQSSVVLTGSGLSHPSLRLQFLQARKQSQRAESPRRTRFELSGALLTCIVCQEILPPERQTVTPEIQDFSGQLSAFNELDSTSDVCPSLQIPNLQMCACWEYDTHFCYDRLIDVRRGLSHTPPPSVGRGCLLLADVSLCIRKKTLHRTEVLHFPWSQESVWGPLYHPGYRAAGWTMMISRQVSPLGWHPCQPTPVLTGVTCPMSFISSSQHPCESSIRSVEMSTTG